MKQSSKHPVYVGATKVGWVEKRFDGHWTAHSTDTNRTAVFAGPVYAECWVREEVYSDVRENAYEDRRIDGGAK